MSKNDLDNALDSLFRQETPNQNKQDTPPQQQADQPINNESKNTTDLKKQAQEIRKTYQRQQEQNKRTTLLRADLLKSIDDAPDAELLDKAMHLIAVALNDTAFYTTASRKLNERGS